MEGLRSMVSTSTSMLKESVSRLKSFCNDFIPFWKWKLVEICQKKQTAQQQYSKVLAACRDLQYVLGFIAVLFAFFLGFSRQLLMTSVLRNGAPIFLMDVFTYIVFGYFLGLKRMPVNFISLVIIKIFIVLEDNFKPELIDGKVSTLGKSKFGGHWSMITARPKTTRFVPASPPAGTIVGNIGIVFMCLVGFWVVGRFTKVDVSKFKISLLISQTVASSSAAVIFILTLTFNAMPGMKEMHRKFCEIWILFAVTTFIFSMAFLFDHLWAAMQRKPKSKSTKNLSVELESFVFMLAFAITIRYLPRFHKDLYIRDVLARKTIRVVELLVPTSLMNAWHIFSAYIYEVGEGIAKMHI